MIDKVRSYIEKYHMIEKGDTIVAGVSGGADSVCLLHVLNRLQPEYGYTLKVVHVEHGIRGAASREDAAFVERLCEKYGISCVTKSYDIPKLAKQQGCSLEEMGRIVRYQSFQEELGTNGNGKIAVAHNKNDLAETMIHHLARGSHLSGLTGIAPKRDQIIRPLLCVERDEIEAYLDRMGQEYRTDSTNSELEYTRNRIRHRILPELTVVNQQAIAHMARTAETLRELQSYVDSEVSRCYEAFVTERQEGYLVACEEMRRIPELIQKQLLYRVLTEAAGHSRDIEDKHIQSLLTLSQLQSGKKLDLPYDVEARREYGNLVLKKKKHMPKVHGQNSTLESDERFEICVQEAGQNSEEWDIILKKKYTKWFDYDKIKDKLCVRTRCPGDYFYMNREGGRKKLKQFFIDEKIPVEERDSILLVAEGSHILWIVGYRISAYYKIDEYTRRVLEIRFLQEEEL